MAVANNLSGFRFHRLTAVRRSGSRGGHALWECICDCGKEVICTNTALKSGRAKSCGCYATEERRSRTIDLRGQRFGRLLVVGPPVRRNDTTFFECLCECGSKSEVRSNALRRGKTKSCGCLFIEAITKHGLSGTPEYQCWDAIIQRCLNPRCANYKNYGGRGISVAEEWRGPGGFGLFMDHIGKRPSDKHSIDRIDNNGNYEPGNVRWATQEVQKRNTRIARLVEWNGKKITTNELSRAIGIAPGHIANLLRRGRSPDWIAANCKPRKKANG